MRTSILILLIALGFLSSTAANRILVDKPTLKIYVINERNDTVFRAPVCVGKNLGQKQRRGDCRTPEGTFTVQQIQDSRSWTHDFGDGAGQRSGAYGPWFIRLRTPGFSGIGIHGTCFPETTGTRASEGCIRLRNEDLTRLKPLVSTGMSVTITPDGNH